MLMIVGTFWPLLGLPLAILLASIASAPAWRLAALMVLPALVYTIHYWLVLPWCLRDGNLLAAVIFGGMLAVGAIYFPTIIVMTVVWLVRKTFRSGVAASRKARVEAES